MDDLQPDDVTDGMLLAAGLVRESALKPKKNHRDEARRLEALDIARRKYLRNFLVNERLALALEGSAEYQRLMNRYRARTGDLPVFQHGSIADDPGVYRQWQLDLLRMQVQEMERAAMLKGTMQELLQNERDPARRRVLRIRLATPQWANMDKIAEIYALRDRVTEETGIEHHVDHVVPLAGRMVCGLHCEANLRVIPATENLQKNSRFAPGVDGGEVCVYNNNSDRVTFGASASVAV
jgi:hypothetical protein